MIIEALTRENGSRKLISADKIFTSFTEVKDYCLESGSKMKPLRDNIALKFLILDTSEIFDVVIGWDEDGEIYVAGIGFPEPSNVLGDIYDKKNRKHRAEK